MRLVHWQPSSRDDAVALCTAGMALAFVVGDLDNGAALIDRALSLNPNLAMAWLFSGWVKVWRGEPEAAIDHLAHATRLNPHDPQIANAQAATANALFFVDRYAEALSLVDLALLDKPNHYVAACVAAASGALGGRLEEARQIMVRLRELDPTLRISNLSQLIPFRRPEDLAKFAQGLRAAGLLE